MAFVFDTPGAGFFSLNFQAKKDVVKAFLEWTDGLASRPSNAKPIVIVTCCASKMTNPLDFYVPSNFFAISLNKLVHTAAALETETGYGHQSAKQH